MYTETISFEQYTQSIVKLCFLILFGIIGLIPAPGQRKTESFHELLFSVPANNQVIITNVDYALDGEFSGTSTDTVRYRNRICKKTKMNEYVGIDAAHLVDYQLDTVVILSAHYIPGGTEEIVFHTGKGSYTIISPDVIVPLEESYGSLPEEIKISDYVLYSALFSWNMHDLLEIIRHSGGICDSEYIMKAMRIIVFDYRVISKDIIYFKPAIRWTNSDTHIESLPRGQM